MSKTENRNYIHLNNTMIQNIISCVNPVLNLSVFIQIQIFIPDDNDTIY